MRGDTHQGCPVVPHLLQLLRECLLLPEVLRFPSYTTMLGLWNNAIE